MSIRIDQRECIGCQRCVNACPGNLIDLNENGRAKIEMVRDCWGCTSCMKECPVAAIHFFLGTDIGGRGSQMYRWEVEFLDGSQKEIVVNRKNSNTYQKKGRKK